MTSPVESARGFLDGVLGPVPPVDPSAAGLSLSTSAVPSPFLIQGRHARVSGDQRHPVGSVDLFRCGRVEDFRLGAARAANVLLFPGMCRRDFVGEAGVHMETVVVAPELPLVVVQWSGDGEPVGSLDFRLRLHADDAAATVAPSGEAIALVSGAQGLLVRTEPACLMTLESEDPSAFRASLTPTKPGTLSLVLAGGTATQVRTALAAASHLTGHVIRAARGPCADGLSLPLGISEVDDAFAWAQVRLRGRIDALAGTPQEPAPAALALELGLAAAAVGDRDGSARILSLPAIAGTPQEAILAARHASTFGDVGRAGEVARGRLADPRTPDHDADLWKLADHALADALLYTVSEDSRAALRALVGNVGRGPRSLPVVGHQRRSDAVGVLAATTRGLLTGVPIDAPEPGSDGPLGEARGAASTFLTRPTEAWQSWRRLMAWGLEHGPDGPATWVEDESGSTAAALLLAITQGMLGMAPDASAGRLKLAPRVPGHLSRFAVDGIPLGDARVTLRYQREGHRHRFELAPERAGVPLLLVFEPAVAGAVQAVRVDGAVADLDLRSEETLTTVPVQLPLDGVRTVEVTTGG